MNKRENLYRKIKKDEGASAVELAIILPLLVILLFGIIEFGRLFNSYIALSHAAREGARLAAVGKFDVNVIEARAYPLTTIEGLIITGPSYPAGNSDIGSPVEVTLNYTHQVNIPFAITADIPLRSKGVMRIE